MELPPYIIVERPTTDKLALAVAEKIQLHGYYPSGSLICHPAMPPDPGIPLRFSQAMVHESVLVKKNQLGILE